EPLVTASRGGKSRGGATLTDLGQEMLAAYRAIAVKATAVTEPEFARLRALAVMRGDPTVPRELRAGLPLSGGLTSADIFYVVDHEAYSWLIRGYRHATRDAAGGIRGFAAEFGEPCLRLRVPHIHDDGDSRDPQDAGHNE